MEGERQLGGQFGALPVATWRFVERTRVGQVRALERVAPTGDDREALTRAFLRLGRLTPEARTEEDAWSLEPLTGGRLTEPLDLRGQTLHGPLEFVDTDFHDDVILTDAVVERSVTFRNCRFLGALSLRNARFKGPLILEGCTVSGLRDRQVLRALRSRQRRGARSDADETVAIDLRGARVEGNLRIVRTKAYGTVHLRGIRVEGRATLNGCAVWPFHELPEWVPPGASRKLRLGLRFVERGAALDLRNGHFEQGLSLSAWFKPTLRQPGMLDHLHCSPTLVVGTVRAEHIHVGGAFEMSGLICADLHSGAFEAKPNRSFPGFVSLADAQIQGQLRLWSSGEEPSDGWKYLRTLMTSLNLDRASIREGDLRGIYVSRNLSARTLHCGGGLEFRPLGQHWIDSLPESFAYWHAPQVDGTPLLDLPAEALQANGRTVARFGRTQIGGSLDLRGAEVNNDVYLDGAAIGRDVNLNDATIGGLSFSVHVSVLLPQHDGKPNRLLAREQGPAVDGPVHHLLDNPLTTHRRCPNGATSPGILMLGAQARRLYVQDAIVDGPIKLGGGTLVGRMTHHDAHARVRAIHAALGQVGSERWDGEDGLAELRLDAPSTQEPDAIASEVASVGHVDTQRREVLRITNTAIEGPLVLQRHGLYHTLTEGILRRPRDRYAFAQLLPGTLDDGLEDWLRDHLPDWATTTRMLGGARIHETRIDGQLELGRVIVDGRLQIVDVTLTSDLRANDKRRPLYAWEVDLETLRTPGDVFVDGLTTGQLDAQNMDIGGRFHLRKVTIPRDANLAGSRCGVLDVSTSSQRHDGELVLQRCTIDLLVLGKPVPNQIDLASTHIKRLETPSERSSYAIIKTVLDRSEGQYDSKVYSMFEQLLRIEGDTWGADQVAWRMHWTQLWNSGQRLLQAPWTSPFGWILQAQEWVDRMLFVVFGVFGRAVTLTMVAGMLTVGASFLVLTGNPRNWAPADDAAVVDMTCQDAVVMALEIGFPPFSPIEGEAAIRQPRTQAPLRPGLPACGLSFFDDSAIDALSPRSTAKGLRAFGWVIWSWFLLLATGLMRRSGGTIAE